MARDSAPPVFRATPMLLLVVGEREAEEDDEVEDDEMGDDEMIKVASVMLKGWRKRRRRRYGGSCFLRFVFVNWV